MFSRRAKPIRINGDPDNQLPDKRSSAVCYSDYVSNFLPIICCFTVPVHLLYFTVAPGFSTMVLLFYSPIVYSRYDRFCCTMLFTYCVFLVVINCGLHPLLYILEGVNSCLRFHILTRTKTLPGDGT
jgi:hypothetical protein